MRMYREPAFVGLSGFAYGINESEFRIASRISRQTRSVAGGALQAWRKSKTIPSPPDLAMIDFCKIKAK